MPKLVKNPKTREFVVETPDGFTDAPLFDPILDNPEAEAAQAERAVARAIERGMSEADALEAYGIPGDRRTRTRPPAED